MESTQKYTWRVFRREDVPGLLLAAEESGTERERTDMRKLAYHLEHNDGLKDKKTVYCIYDNNQLLCVESRHWIQYPPPRPDDDTDEWMAEAAQAHVDALYAQDESEGVQTAKDILENAHLKTFAESAELTDAQLVVVGQAGFFDEWAAGQLYAAGKRLTHGGTVYVVMQAVASLEHQPPGADGMLAIYRPVETGHAGSEADPIPFVNGMDVASGKYYVFDGVVYLAKADMKPCVWNPGTAGVWQWELVGGSADASVSVMAAIGGEAAERYLLNSTKSTYHRIDCEDAVTGSLRTLDYIADNNPGAKACARCMPPELATKGA